MGKKRRWQSDKTSQYCSNTGSPPVPKRQRTCGESYRAVPRPLVGAGGIREHFPPSGLAGFSFNTTKTESYPTHHNKQGSEEWGLSHGSGDNGKKRCNREQGGRSIFLRLDTFNAARTDSDRNKEEWGLSHGPGNKGKKRKQVGTREEGGSQAAQGSGAEKRVCYTVPHYSAPPRVVQTHRSLEEEHSGGIGMNSEGTIDFFNTGQLDNLLKAKIGHQVSSLINNVSFSMYLQSSSSDFASVTMVTHLIENAIFCEIEPLKKKVQNQIIPKLLENRGFLEALRYHLCTLPRKANDQERACAVSYIGRVCRLFELILSSGDVVLASSVLPVDALWGTTRQLELPRKCAFNHCTIR